MSSAQAKIEITADTAKLPAALARAKKMFAGFAETVGGGTRDLFVGAAKGLMHGTATAIGFRGLDFLIEQGKGVLDFNRELVRFGISVRKTPAEMEAIGRAARQTSSEIGTGALEVLKAGRAYVDLAGAENFSIDSMNILARAAKASGAATTDLAGMMYQLKVSMKVPDNQMEETIGGLINQAKDGAIEARQMATEFAAILPLFARFGVVGREGAVQAGALFQVMRNGANTAAEAGTMMQRVYAGIQSYAPRFEAQGIKVYESFRDGLGRKVLRPFPSIFKDIVGSEAMKDPAVVKKMFGRTEGWRGILLGDEAARSFGKTSDGIDKTISKLAELEAAGRVNGVVQHDLAIQTESAAGRIDIAWERVKNGFAEALTPERIDQVVAGIERIAGAMPSIVSAISTAMDAFSGMIHLFRGAGDRFGGGIRNYQAAPDDPFSRSGGATNPRMDRRRKGWEGFVDELLATESPTGPTDASIERAMRVASFRGGQRTPEQEGEQMAARAYIKDRDVPGFVLKRIQAKIDKEQTDAAAAINGPLLAAAIKDAIADGFRSAMYSPAFRAPMEVTMDGTKVNSVTGNAAGNRRQ